MNDLKVFKLGIGNDVGIPYKWYSFGFETWKSRLRLRLTAIRREFELHECLLHVDDWLISLSSIHSTSYRHQYVTFWRVIRQLFLVSRWFAAGVKQIVTAIRPVRRFTSTHFRKKTHCLSRTVLCLRNLVIQNICIFIVMSSGVIKNEWMNE